MPILIELLKMRIKPKWRGTIVAAAGVTAGDIVLNSSARPSKILLWIFFVITFAGGTLAVVDSVRQINAARRQMHKNPGDKNDVAL